MRELPKGWISVPIASITTITSGYGFPIRYQGQSEGALPFFKVGDISRCHQRGDRTLVRAEHYISQQDARTLRASPIAAGAVVFAKIGAAIALNRRAMLGQPSLIDNNAMAISPANSSLDEVFLYWFMRNTPLGGISQATVVPSIRKSDVEAILIALPPVLEQRRIVAKLEELFSELDAGVAALRHAQRRLTRYRQSLLHAAVTGELTREWRERGTTETAVAGLSGRTQTNPEEELDLEGAPQLPDGWSWKSIRSFGRTQTGSTPPTANPEFYGGTIPFYRPTELDDGLNVQHSKVTLTEAGLWATRAIPENTVMVTCIGATIGKTGLARKAGATNQQINSLIASPDNEPRYLFWTLSSPLLQAWIKERANSTTLPILNKSKFDLLPIPAPPLAEQRAILAELDRRLSAVEVMESTIQASLRRAERLRQSILERAFRGELVPQDPCDEPATVMLDKIRSKAAPPAPTRRGRPRKEVRV